MRRSAALLALVVYLLGIAPAQAGKKDKPPVPSVEKPGDVKKGKTGLLVAPKGMRYFLRVPKKYDEKEGAPLLVFLHGSNMNGMQYLPMFPAKKWYDHAILCAPNGETGNDPFGPNNFTQQSAPLVADVVEQVQAAFEVTHTYVGGHSQGGFLTYSVIMHYPDLFQGALPMAGDCWMQNEPNLWEDKPEVMARQKQIAIAVIHGKADPVVRFEQGQHAYDVFRAMGYPKLRLFAPERLGHQFGLSPVGEALLWLDAMNGLDPKKGLKAAGKWARQGEWGWVVQAAKAYRERDEVSASDKAKAGKLLAKAEAAGAEAAPGMQALMQGDKEPSVWLPIWWEFWRTYGATEAGQPLVAAYLARRDAERATGSRLWRQAFGLSRGGQTEACYEVLERLLKEAPHTFDAYYAVSWLAKR